MSRRPYHAHSLELGAICRAVVLGVVAEDSGTVEGAIILREVKPALETVRALPTDSKTNDMGGTAGHRRGEPVKFNDQGALNM